MLDEMSPRHPTTWMSFSRRAGSDQAKFVEIALRDELSVRDARWSEAVAVGNLNFVEKMKSEKRGAAHRELIS
jgi:hypothetical protein